MDILILGNRGALGKILSQALSKRFDTYGLDLDDLDLLDECEFREKLIELSKHKRDFLAVINCAGLMGAKESNQNPEPYLKSNGILPYISRKNISDFFDKYLYIQISSETVYGPSINIEKPFTEVDPCLPAHNYALSKLIGEQLLVSGQDKKSITLILRVPIIIYPSQKYDNALTEMIKQIKETGKVTVHGDGSHVRNYVDCQYLINCIEMLLTNYWKFDKTNFGVDLFNIPGVSIAPNDFLDSLSKVIEFHREYFEGATTATSLVSDASKFLNTFSNFKFRPNYGDIYSNIVGSNG